MIDFDMNKYILKTLEPLDVPVFFAARKEVNLPIVLFNVSGERGYAFEDDEEVITKYRVVFNIFSKGNYIHIKNEMKKLLKQAGFIRTDIPACIYLEDTEIYNQPMYYEFYLNVDNKGDKINE